MHWIKRVNVTYGCNTLTLTYCIIQWLTVCGCVPGSKKFCLQIKYNSRKRHKVIVDTCLWSVLLRVSQILISSANYFKTIFVFDTHMSNAFNYIDKSLLGKVEIILYLIASLCIIIITPREFDVRSLGKLLFLLPLWIRSLS